MDYDTKHPVYVYTRSQLFLHDSWLWIQGAVFGISFATAFFFLIWPKK